MDESILQEFIIEAQDHFETIEDDFLRLADDPANPDRDMVDKVFRAIHSVKGGAGFLQLTSIAKLSHAMENLLSAVRADEIQLTREIIDALLAGVDMVNSMFEAPAESNDVDITPIRDKLLKLLAEASSDQAKADMRTDVNLEEAAGCKVQFQLTKSTLKMLPAAHEYLYLLHYDLDKLWKSSKQTPVELVRKLDGVGEIVDGQLMELGEDLSEGLPEGPLYYDVLFSSLIGPETIALATGLEDDQVTVLNKQALLEHAQDADSGVCLEDTDQGDDLVIDLDGDLESPAQEEAKPVSKEVAGDMAVQFASEADEQLESLEEVLCQIFDNPTDTSDSLREAFRLTHSFKGNAGIVGASDLERVSHSLESALDFFRETTAPRRDADRSVLFAALDGLRTGVASLLNGEEGTIPHSERLMRDLESLTEPSEPDQAPGEAAATRTATAAKKTERNDIRVDLGKLDDLMNLVGELVIGEAMVTRNPDLEDLVSERFERAAHNLRRIVSDLQDVAMSVRMVPLSRTFRRMIRLVHDVSAKAGKKVRLDLVGEDTEVDKTVIEQVGDPLVHLIRNSVDHGLEPPEDRLAAGKPETGVVTISAGHEGGEVVIKVADDGRGLPRDKILDKARKQGLVTDDGSRMSDEDVYRLIFEPGFSTAEKVTDISGRGVGMDVVKRNLERIKGRVDVRSTPGQGSVMILRIPLTLAIIDGMLVRVGTTRYTIPLLSIRQSFRPVDGQVSRSVDGQELADVRGELVPVVRMHDFYGTTGDFSDLQEGILICVGAADRQICLFADEILGHHQTVIKAMPGTTGSAKGISGCTILGDGEVSLILDVENLMDAAEHAADNLQPRGDA